MITRPAAHRAFAVDDVISEADPNVATAVPEPLNVEMIEAALDAVLYVTADADEPVVVPDVADDVVPLTKYAATTSPATGVDRKSVV